MDTARVRHRNTLVQRWHHQDTVGALLFRWTAGQYPESEALHFRGQSHAVCEVGGLSNWLTNGISTSALTSGPPYRK